MMNLQMAQITFDARGVFEWAHAKGFSRNRDYTIHAVTRAAFGSLGPQPWALPSTNPSEEMIVLGYGAATSDMLHQHLAGAEPPLREAILGVRTKEMPAMPAGNRYRFAVRVCPVRRGAAEIDIAKGASPADRLVIYREWLARKLEGSATLLDCALTRFQLIRAYCHDHNAPVRRIRGLYTDATLSGLLEVQDADVFREKLRHGIGRHKIAGYGMILLQKSR